jgi:hypothetical protein
LKRQALNILQGRQPKSTNLKLHWLGAAANIGAL